MLLLHGLVKIGKCPQIVRRETAPVLQLPHFLTIPPSRTLPLPSYYTPVSCYSECSHAARRIPKPLSIFVLPKSHPAPVTPCSDVSDDCLVGNAMSSPLFLVYTHSTFTRSMHLQLHILYLGIYQNGCHLRFPSSAPRQLRSNPSLPSLSRNCSSNFLHRSGVTRHATSQPPTRPRQNRRR